MLQLPHRRWRPWCLWRNGVRLEREYLFNLEPSDINHAIYGQDKDMGISSHGVPGLNAETLLETMCHTTLSTKEKSSKLFNEHMFATFISGCLLYTSDAADE